ncbi:unknown [Prevotella sp. CAG:873]|nr:unknown [Prevotella sp. CAG:873]
MPGHRSLGDDYRSGPCILQLMHHKSGKPRARAQSRTQSREANVTTHHVQHRLGVQLRTRHLDILYEPLECQYAQYGAQRRQPIRTATQQRRCQYPHCECRNRCTERHTGQRQHRRRNISLFLRGQSLGHHSGLQRSTERHLYPQGLCMERR